MKRIRILVIIVFLLLNLFHFNVYAIDDEKILDEKVFSHIDYNNEFSNDEILVVLNYKSSRNDKHYNENDFSEIECIEVDDLTNGYQISDLNEKFRKILKLKVKDEGRQSIINKIDILMKRDDIVSAEPNYYLKACSDDWPIQDIIDNYSFKKQYDIISLYETFKFKNDLSNISIGIIDTGIDGNHELIKDSIDVELSKSFISENDNPLVDLDGHGTFIAGILASKNLEHYYYEGIAYKANIVSLKIAESIRGNKDVVVSNMIEAINYAKNKKIDILNLSWRINNDSTYMNSFCAALLNYDGIITCSAGNNSDNNDEIDHYPSNLDYDNLISVGATNNNDERWELSNYGAQTVDIYAPGNNIFSTIPNNSSDSASNNKLGILSGTSFATPFVTGVAAILLSINSSLTPYQIKNAILSGADNIQISVPNESSSNSTITQNVKRLNAYGAVKYVISNYIDEQFLQAYGTDTEEYITLLPNQKEFYKLNVQSKRNYRIIFSGNRNVDIKLYDSNFNEIAINDLNSSQQVEELIIGLEKNIYYIKLENIDDSNGKFKFIINSFDSQYINSLKTYDLLLNYNNKVQTYYFKNNNGIGFYDFILTGQKSDGTSISYPQGVISINNSYDSTIYNLNIPETQKRAINDENNNCVTAFLYNDETFNIQLNINETDLIKLTLEIRKSENFKIDLFDLPDGINDEMLILNMSDEVDLVKEYHLLQDGLFDLEIRYAGQQTDPILFKIYKPIYNQSLDMYLLSSIFVDNISVDNMITTINNIKLDAGLYYICYFENELEGAINVKLTRKMNIKENDVLVSDPKDPTNYNITCGSMINIYESDLSFNSKSFRSTSIIQGFTRIVYIDSNVRDYINNKNNNYDYISRESYNWYSDNEDVLSVSNYGTVFGKSAGTAKIMAVHKDDPSVFFLKTFEVEYDRYSYDEKVVSVIRDNHKLSDGKYLINLTIQNCPYPSIEYYYWQIISKDSTIIDVSIDKWGYVKIVGTGEIIIEGISYRYNNNYTVKIILNVTN